MAKRVKIEGKLRYRRSQREGNRTLVLPDASKPEGARFRWLEDAFFEALKRKGIDFKAGEHINGSWQYDIESLDVSISINVREVILTE